MNVKLSRDHLFANVYFSVLSWFAPASIPSGTRDRSRSEGRNLRDFDTVAEGNVCFYVRRQDMTSR
jgi:hypothetical protein